MHEQEALETLAWIAEEALDWEALDAGERETVKEALEVVDV